MNTYTPGSKPTLTGRFQDLDGDPVTPITITAKVRSPSGSINTYTPPQVVVPDVGTATVQVTVDEPGFWFYRFEGSGDVVSPQESAFYVRESQFDTDAADSGPYFGATIDGVKDHLPDRTVNDASKPSEAAVSRFIAEIAARVSARIGAIDTVTDAARRSSLIDSARGLVHLGAASWAEAAGAPEQADAEAASAYSSWLWARFTEGLDELAAVAVGLIPPDAVDDPDIAAGSPIWSFPNTPAYGLATSHFERY